MFGVFNPYVASLGDVFGFRLTVLNVATFPNDRELPAYGAVQVVTKLDPSETHLQKPMVLFAVLDWLGDIDDWNGTETAWVTPFSLWEVTRVNEYPEKWIHLGQLPRPPSALQIATDYRLARHKDTRAWEAEQAWERLGGCFAGVCQLSRLRGEVWRQEHDREAYETELAALDDNNADDQAERRATRKDWDEVSAVDPFARWGHVPNGALEQLRDAHRTLIASLNRCPLPRSLDNLVERFMVRVWQIDNAYRDVAIIETLERDALYGHLLELVSLRGGDAERLAKAWERAERTR